MQSLPATWTTPKATITLSRAQFGDGLRISVRMTGNGRYGEASLLTGVVSTVPDTRQAAELRAAGLDPSTRRVYGALFLPVEVCAEIDAISLNLGAQAKAARDEREARIAAIPGLKELEAALNDRERYSCDFDRMMSSEHNDGVRPPRPVSGNVEELSAAYPVAAAYILADSWCGAAHDVKASAGKKALEAIIAGAEAAGAIAEMKATWSRHTEGEMWGS